MTASHGILAFGAYVPRYRLERAAIYAANGWFAPELKGLAKGTKAVADWDEDSVTMAVEAARDCLHGRERTGVAQVVLASTTQVFADRQNAGIVKEALNLQDGVATLDVAGSLRAGTGALMQALARSDAEESLVCAADRRVALPASEAEMTYGDGAGALLIGPGNPVAVHLGSKTLSVDFVDHHRTADAQSDSGWEARWLRDEGIARLMGGAICDALESLDIAAESITRFICPVGNRKVAQSLARKAGIGDEAVVDGMDGVVGNCGAAHPLLLLASVLENAKPGERILVAGFGQGVDVIALETTEAIGATRPFLGPSGWIARARPDGNYQRYLAHRGLVHLDGGLRAEAEEKVPLTALYRKRQAAFGLVGGKCRETGTVQFPKTTLGVAPNAHHADTQDDYPLADLPARIFTFTSDRLTYSPNPPYSYGHVDFEGGGRWMFEITDVEPEDLETGMPVRMMFRIKSIDTRRNFRHYFWKAVPGQPEPRETGEGE